MSFYLLSLIVFSISVLSVSVPVSSSVDNPNKSLSYTEKRCENEYCTITTCFEDKQCRITDSNDSPTETTNSNDKIRQLFGDFDSDSELQSKNLEFMDMFVDEFFDFN